MLCATLGGSFAVRVSGLRVQKMWFANASSIALTAMLVCFALSAGDAHAASTIQARRKAENALLRLVQAAAMKADYGHATLVRGGFACAREEELEKVAGAIAATPPESTVSSDLLCGPSVESHHENTRLTISVQSRPGASCDKFKKNLRDVFGDPIQFGRNQIEVRDVKLLREVSEKIFHTKVYDVFCDSPKYRVSFSRRLLIFGVQVDSIFSEIDRLLDDE